MEVLLYMEEMIGPLFCPRFCGVVVITSASHAEGHEFEPRQNLCFLACAFLLAK